MPRDFSEDGAIGAGGGDEDGYPPVSNGTSGGPSSFSMPGGPPQPGGLNQNFGGASTGAPSNFSFSAPSGAGLFMEGGGAIDDSMGSPDQDAIQKALSTVDGVLAFGRKLHGLGGGANEGAIQTAANMPTAPASQSESGVPPLQPRPGALPPTSNPFGKRRTAENDSDDSGAIDTEEETA